MSSQRCAESKKSIFCTITPTKARDDDVSAGETIRGGADLAQRTPNGSIITTEGDKAEDFEELRHLFELVSIYDDEEEQDAGNLFRTKTTSLVRVENDKA